MTHTKGPWKYTKHATKYDDLFTYDVIQAQPDSEFGSVCGITSGLDSKADACLITAAPELLEACKLLAAWDQSNDDVNLISMACSMARQAIAKAKGDKI